MDIDFYILETTSKQQGWLFACKLIANAFTDAQPIFVYTSSQDEATKLDKLLWTFQDDSFLPHSLTQDSTEAPILIGSELKAGNTPGTLVNLSLNLPDHVQQFTKIIEVVIAEPQTQQLARERYRYYRDAGYNLNTHKLKANAL